LAGLRIDELDLLVSEKDLNRKRTASPLLTCGGAHSNPPRWDDQSIGRSARCVDCCGAMDTSHRGLQWGQRQTRL